MAAGLSEAIRSLVSDKGISEELIIKTIEDFLLAAYKRKFGTVDNAVVKFSDDGDEVSLFAQKQIVEDVEDPVGEIALDDALELNSECELGDELLIEIDPKQFDRISIQSAKQKARQTLREIQKDTLYSEYKGKEGEMIIGYYQREKNGDIFIDLGKIEGLLPKRYQSPREYYHQGDRVKSYIYSVEKGQRGLSVILSRTHTEFVKKLFEVEVPEVYDHTIEIYKIVREPGYRTKMAVYTNREEVDPVGACVGMKGTRIQTIVKELEGEKIDVLRYETDPHKFIKNALSPAEVKQVYILDETKRSALAVVADNQLSLAIGKQGLNVRLANRLVDWNIDVKTEEQFAELDVNVELRKGIDALFNEEHFEQEQESEEEYIELSDIPEIDAAVVNILKENGIEAIEDYINTEESVLLSYSGIDEEVIKNLNELVNEYVDIIEEDSFSEFDENYEETPENSKETGDVSSSSNEQYDDEETVADETIEDETVEEETYLCPECSGEITADMSVCPHCGVGLSFEYEEDTAETEEEKTSDKE